MLATGQRPGPALQWWHHLVDVVHLHGYCFLSTLLQLGKVSMHCNKACSFCVVTASPVGKLIIYLTTEYHFVREKFSQKMLQYPSHRILRYVHGALNVDKKKLITQFD